MPSARSKSTTACHAENAESAKAESTPFRIDFANIARRVLPLPIDASEYTKLAAKDGKAFYLVKNALKSFDHTAPAVLGLAGIDPRRRPETLQVTEIARLAELFTSVRGPRVV